MERAAPTNPPEDAPERHSTGTRPSIDQNRIVGNEGTAEPLGGSIGESLRELGVALHAAGDPIVAEGMRSYMRDRFPFLGVKTPVRRATSRPLVRASTSLDPGELAELVDALRAMPEREFHYVASDVLRANDRRLPADFIDPIRRWIVTDSWWDTVDAIASPTVGTMIRSHPALLDVMDAWIDDEDIWLARTAILHQLRFGDDTDQRRLFDYADRRAADSEFFIRKAIGWALRQYARTDPGAVRRFVDARRDELSGLTIREATKHLG